MADSLGWVNLILIIIIIIVIIVIAIIVFERLNNTPAIITPITPPDVRVNTTIIQNGVTTGTVDQTVSNPNQSNLLYIKATPSPLSLTLSPGYNRVGLTVSISNPTTSTTRIQVVAGNGVSIFNPGTGIIPANSVSQYIVTGPNSFYRFL